MKVCKTATLVVFWIVAHACAASFVAVAMVGAAGAGATAAFAGACSGETTNWKLPLIGDVETQGCCALPVERITSRPTSPHRWKPRCLALRMDLAKALVPA